MAKKKKPRAFSKRAMRVRISMIARERGLSDAEIAKALNCGTAAVVAFAEKHDISLDWLVCGDLKGLLRTVRAKQQSG
jgi:predicted transcriptional regulator